MTKFNQMVSPEIPVRVNLPVGIKARLQEQFDLPAKAMPWGKELVFSSDISRTRGDEEVNASADNGGGCIYDNHPRTQTMYYDNFSEYAMKEPYFPMEIISGKMQYKVSPIDNLQTGEHADIFYQTVTDEEGTTGFMERGAYLDRY